MQLFNKCIKYIDLWFGSFNAFGERGNTSYENNMRVYATKVDEYMKEIEDAGLLNMFLNYEEFLERGYTVNNIDFIRRQLSV